MCRYLVFLAIRIYWLLIPSRWRRTCIFRQSCSQYVYHMTAQHGLLAGWRAFVQRWRTCRPHYHLERHDGNICIRLADGSLANAQELSDSVLSQYSFWFYPPEAKEE
jgi:putative component of membrane protein insertase Oxa1/YidC/SpoIIIJ protein YidD